MEVDNLLFSCTGFQLTLPLAPLQVHFDCLYRGVTAVSSRESKLLAGNRIIAQVSLRLLLLSANIWFHNQDARSGFMTLSYSAAYLCCTSRKSAQCLKECEN